MNENTVLAILIIVWAVGLTASMYSEEETKRIKIEACRSASDVTACIVAVK